MSDIPVGLHPKGLPETVIPAEDDATLAAFVEAKQSDPEQRKAAVAEVVSAHPRFLAGWAELGDLSEGIEAYAYYRIGYHRGLDKLRAAGWRGSGYVRWRHLENRGFLRCLVGLGNSAAEIGEQDEVDRIRQFIHQLDPDMDAQVSGNE